jgi:hypothetical protein
MTDNHSTPSAAESADGDGKGAEKLTATQPHPELPVEIRTKLRKLEKLESRYQGMPCYLA